MPARLLTLLAFVIAPAFSQGCFDHELIREQGLSFQSHILFFKTDELLAIQQHHVRYQGREYFNFSLCIKDQGGPGFRLSEAAEYNFDRDCQMLGSWLPVQDSEGVNVVQGLLSQRLGTHLELAMSEFENRSEWEPLVDSLRGVLSDYRNWFLAAAGAVIVRQSFMTATYAQLLGRGAQTQTGVRAGVFFLGMSLLGMYAEARSQADGVQVNLEKLHEVGLALERIERQFAQLQQGNLDQMVNYPLPSPILSVILEALALSMVELEVSYPEVCAPPVPENLRGFTQHI